MVIQEGQTVGRALASPTPLDYLKGLYTFVATLSLQEAVQQLVIGSPDVSVRWHTLPLALAFLVTLVPFYHGALRHLDTLYAPERSPQRRGVMLIDFGLLFVESGILFALARTIASPHYFAWTLVVLLATDVVWAVAVTLLTGKEFPHESNWVRVNLVTFPILALFAWLAPGSTELLLAVASITVTRSVVDYTLSWEYYFP